MNSERWPAGPSETWGLADPDALVDCLRRMSSALEPGGASVLEVIERAVVIASDATGAPWGGATLALGDDVATVVPPSSATIAPLQSACRVGPGSRSLDDGEPVALDDLESSTDRWPVFVEIARVSGVTSVLSVPMRTDGRVLGAIDLYDRDGRRWTPSDVAVVGVLADLLADRLAPARSPGAADTLAAFGSSVAAWAPIEQAKGLVASTYHVTLTEAYVLLRFHARRNGMSLTDFASWLLSERRLDPS